MIVIVIVIHGSSKHSISILSMWICLHFPSYGIWCHQYPIAWMIITVIMIMMHGGSKHSYIFYNILTANMPMSICLYFHINDMWYHQCHQYLNNWIYFFLFKLDFKFQLYSPQEYTFLLKLVIAYISKKNYKKRMQWTRVINSLNQQSWGGGY